jgi:hypothetical protein
MPISPRPWPPAWPASTSIPTTSSDAPFSQLGGLGKAHEVFGDRLTAVLDELNRVLAAARKEPRLYDLLALVDALRGGRARERAAAEAELRKRRSADEPSAA